MGVRTQRMLIVVTTAALCGGVCPAQSSEFRLDESRQWATASAPEPGTDADVIARARRALAEDKPAAAQDLLDPWIEQNRRAGNPYMPEALLLRGDALVALDREFKALYDYEEICKKHRESEVFTEAVNRELEIAIRYANGLRIRVLGIRWGDPEDVLVELFLRVTERLPRSQAAERAMIELADYYYRQRELAQAKDVYDAYLQTFPSGPNSLLARQRKIQCEVGRFKGPRYNAAPLIDARVQIEQFERRYPAEAEATGLNEALASRLDESMAAQLLDTARWYLRIGDEPSARLVLGRLLRDHPLTLSAERGTQMLKERGWGPPASSPPVAEQSPASEQAEQPVEPDAQEGGAP